MPLKLILFVISVKLKNTKTFFSHRRFRNKYKIPNVIGMIDGTHIGIFPPDTNNGQYPEFVYVNRKKYHSINTQVVS